MRMEADESVVSSHIDGCSHVSADDSRCKYVILLFNSKYD